MKKIQNVEGNYSSTYSFVQKNKLEKVANKLFGKGWEAEDDVNQIEEIILAMNIGRHSVECIEEISADNDDILVRKVSDSIINIDKAFKQLISLYDVCDDLENNGEDKSAKKMRATLNKLGAFIQSLKN
jgi:hypothetical protein